MVLLEDARNSNIGKRVRTVLERRARGGQLIDCSGNDLTAVAFSFPDCTDGVYNVTLERAADRENWGFWGSCVSRQGVIRHYARCISRNLDFEVVEEASFPGKQLFYRNASLIGSCSLLDLLTACVLGDVPWSWTLATTGSTIGTLFRESGTQSGTLYIDTAEWGRLSLGTITSGSRGNFLKNLLYTLSFSWLSVEPQQNHAYVIPVDWPALGNVDVEQVLFLTALLFATDSFVLHTGRSIPEL